jgi:hypothetical protein
MSGKDILTLLLAIYGFKDIKIYTYRGVGNAQGYNIDAYNKKRNYYYLEENCEGLLFNITKIIEEMKEKHIEPTYTIFPGHEYTPKEIINKVQYK